MLDSAELQDCAPEVTQTLLAPKALVRYVKQTYIISQLSKTVRQMSDTRFSTVFLTLDSIKLVYAELREKLESCGESQKLYAISPDVLEFLLEFTLHTFCGTRGLSATAYLCRMTVLIRQSFMSDILNALS